MIHDLDLLLAAVRSEVASIEAVGVNVLTPSTDIANARLRFASGCIANLTASRISRERVRKVRFFQPDSYMSIDYAAQEVEVYRLVPRRRASGDPGRQAEMWSARNRCGASWWTSWTPCAQARAGVTGRAGRDALALATTDCGVDGGNEYLDSRRRAAGARSARANVVGDDIRELAARRTSCRSGCSRTRCGDGCTLRGRRSCAWRIARSSRVARSVAGQAREIRITGSPARLADAMRAVEVHKSRGDRTVSAFTWSDVERWRAGASSLRCAGALRERWSRRLAVLPLDGQVDRGAIVIELAAAGSPSCD